MNTAQTPIGFGYFAVAIIVLLFILALVPEPYSTWLAGVVILGAFYADNKANGSNAVINTIFTPTTPTQPFTLEPVN